MVGSVDGMNTGYDGYFCFRKEQRVGGPCALGYCGTVHTLLCSTLTQALQECVCGVCVCVVCVCVCVVCVWGCSVVGWWCVGGGGLLCVCVVCMCVCVCVWCVCGVCVC